jgi:hypothetical protein
MKYWNKDKKIREQYWHRVALPNNKYSKSGDWYYNSNWESLPSYQDMKSWGQQQMSKGKFFGRRNCSEWYFQSEADAVLFALKWS